MIEKVNGFKCKIIPGYDGHDQSPENLLKVAQSIGFPVMIKSALGGGGKGMSIVHDPSAFVEQLESCKRISQSSFGSDRVLIEKYVDPVKHIEVQIMGDDSGNVIHIYERDCSIQRRYQKIIEETPSNLPLEVLEEIRLAATLIGKEVGYRNAGTVEFIVDLNTLDFYFLEVNTRLQVEHPISEMITGLDFVKMQIKIAEGYTISEIVKTPIERRGHAIECRLYGEDALNEFYPSSGPILWFKPPHSSLSRNDTHLKTGMEISIHYDPMLAKIVTYAHHREEAILKMKQALKDMVLLGPIHHNRAFLLHLLDHETFQSRKYHTKFIESWMKTDGYRTWLHNLWHSSMKEHVYAAFLLDWMKRHREFNKNWRHIKPGFRNNSLNSAQVQTWTMMQEIRPFIVTYEFKKKCKTLGTVEYHFQMKLNEKDTQESSLEALILYISQDGTSYIDLDHPISPRGSIRYQLGTKHVQVDVCQDKDDFMTYYTSEGGKDLKFRKVDRLEGKRNKDEGIDDGTVLSHINGKIISVKAKQGAQVKKGDVLIVIESMKMESKIVAKEDGTMEQVHAKEGQLTKEGELLLKINVCK